MHSTNLKGKASMPEQQYFSSQVDVCRAVDARRVAAMLDVDVGGLVEESPLPIGWHSFMLGGETKRSSLRDDGFPGLGIAMPDLGLPKLVLGGREVEFLGDLRIGDRVMRESALTSVSMRETDGKSAIVKFRHTLRPLGSAQPAVIETQTYVMLSYRRREAPAATVSAPVEADIMKIVVPDATLMFQYSALGFNSHKIHLDRDYARDIEGYADLVVNGGLTTLLLTELLRNELGLAPRRIRTRHAVPLFCGRPITLAAKRVSGNWRLSAHDEMGTTAVDLEVSV